MAADSNSGLGRNIKQVDEKHVSVEVRSMAWSPKMDLLALANANHEVLLYRLTWQKVWSLPPPSDDNAIVGLAWRPDGKVLAVAYSRGQVALHGVEKAEHHHTHYTYAAPVAGAFSWLSCELEPRRSCGDADQAAESPIFQEHCHEFLPKLPAVNKDGSEEEYEPTKRVPDSAELSLLVVGCESGVIHIYAFGLLCIANINLTDYELESCTIISTCLSKDLSVLSVITTSSAADQPEKETVTLVTLSIPLLASRHHELKTLACKFVRISALFEYCSAVIKQMQESWEDILLEMDVKLMRLAEQKQAQGANSMMHDLTELLMFGSPSDELQNFLLHDLTEKGLKKLGISIDNYYSTMQRLVLRNMQSGLDSILYHVIDLRGMASWYDRFGVIGLSLSSVKAAVSSIGSLLLKASELSQVVDMSSKSLRAFFKWLYITILRLSEEPVPADVSRLLMQDFSFVAEFLKENFMEADEQHDRKRTGFKLEKVGQYLKEEDIHISPSLIPLIQSEVPSHGPDGITKKNPWLTAVQTGQLGESELLFAPKPSKSLVKLFQEAMGAINSALTNPSVVIGKSLEGGTTIRLFSCARTERPSIVQFSAFVNSSDSLSHIYTLYTSSNGLSGANHINIVKQTVENRCVVSCGFGSGMFGSWSMPSTSSHRSNTYAVVDVRHCLDCTVALLLCRRSELTDAIGGTGAPTVAAPAARLSVGSSESVLVQLSLDEICPEGAEQFYSVVPPDGCDLSRPSVEPAKFNVGNCVDLGNVKVMDNVAAKQIAVSGPRKVASVLLSNSRRVRLFMLDAGADDDDEEGDDAGSSTADSTLVEPDVMVSAHDNSDMDNKENSRVL